VRDKSGEEDLSLQEPNAHDQPHSTRAQAIADGVLIDVSARAREAGLKYPVAMTAAVWDKYVKLTPAAERACNDEQGRLWDILCEWLGSLRSTVEDLYSSSSTGSICAPRWRLPM